MHEIRGSNVRGGELDGPISSDSRPEADFPGAGIKEAALPRLSTRSPSPIPRTRRPPLPCPATLLTQTLSVAQKSKTLSHYRIPISFDTVHSLSTTKTEDERALRLEGADLSNATTGSHVLPRFEPSHPRRPRSITAHRIASRRNIAHPPYFNTEGIAGSAFIRHHRRDLSVAVAPHPTPTSTTLQ